MIWDGLWMIWEVVGTIWEVVGMTQRRNGGRNNMGRDKDERGGVAMIKRGAEIT